jgi:hypothetical protein
MALLATGHANAQRIKVTTSEAVYQEHNVSLNHHQPNGQTYSAA